MDFPKFIDRKRYISEVRSFIRILSIKTAKTTKRNLSQTKGRK
jgi:hypothetical protein